MSEQDLEQGEKAVPQDSVGQDEAVWASAGGCGPAMDAAEAWTRMGDTCCGDEGDSDEL